MNEEQLKKMEEQLSKLDQVLSDYDKEKLKLEAEDIEAKLAHDPIIDEMEPPKELYDKIVAQLKKMGVYREDD